jgi:ribosomal protein S18 acetylase RimI-like enzyme
LQHHGTPAVTHPVYLTDLPACEQHELMNEARIEAGTQVQRVADLDAAWPALEALISDSHVYYLPIIGFGPPADWRDEIRGRLQRADGIVLLAVDASGAIGYANAWLEAGRIDGTSAYIDNVYVLSRARRTGAGSAMLEAIATWAREAGATALRLWVRPGNQIAVAFWRRAGFVAETGGEAGGYVAEEGVDNSTVIMSRAIEART